MAGNFKFELVTPERVLVTADVSDVLIPGADGEFSVLAGHAPVISTLRPGVLAAKRADSTLSRYYIAGGFCEVTPDSLTVLAEKAHDVAAMDKATVQAQLDAAQKVFDDDEADDEARHHAHHAITHINSLTGLPD